MQPNLHEHRPGEPARRPPVLRPPVLRPPVNRDRASTGTVALSELQRTAGNAAVSGMMVMRHPVAGTLVHRHTAADLFGAPGTTLAEFDRSIEVQADWFAEPSLTAADRTDLHALLLKAAEGPHIMAAVGDVLLTELRAVAAGDWSALAEYGRGRRNTGDTVRLIDPAPRPLADRIAIGRTLLALSPVIPAAKLGASVSEAQLLDVHTGALVPVISAYFGTFQPNLEMTYEVTPGARPVEFQHLLDLLRGPGTAPFATLLGRVRNLHRFPVTLLTNLVINFADVSRRRPVHLILHGGHDAAGAFQESAGLFNDLIADPRNLHLMLEGQGSLADITAAVPTIAATFGKLDKGGTPRIGQVMIAGHGEAQTVSLAENDSMNLDPANPAQRTATVDLLDTLLKSMDPETARVVYAGCLVGSNPVPAGTPAADIGAHIAANPSLGTFTEQRGAALGLKPGFTQAARASVGLSASSSLMDASGNMGVQYNFDPNAYGDALTYVATGHEPEGLFRAAVEVAATAGPVAAENQLRIRLATGAAPDHGWFDQCTIAFVSVALAGVAPGTGVSAEKLNMLGHMVGPPFLVGNSEDGHGRRVSDVVSAVNGQPLAGDVYTELGKAGLFVAPAGAETRNGKFTIEQAWLNFGGARAATLVAWLDATPTATTGWIRPRLDAAAIAAASPALFPAAAAASVGRIRLALAWLQADPANVDVRAFLIAQVLRPAAGPELSAPVKAELGGISEDEVLDALGVVPLAPVLGGGGGGGGGGVVELPAANAQVRKGKGNEVRIDPRPYEATVIPGVLNVRTLPGMHGTPFDWVHAGDVLQVTGFTHDWAAVDRNGRLGFVHRSKVTPP